MKYLLLCILSVSAFATEITTEEFLNRYMKNIDTISNLEAGMTSVTVIDYASLVQDCDQNGCVNVRCEYQTTRNETIMAVFFDQYYTHQNRSTRSLNSDPICSLDSSEANETRLMLRTNNSRRININDLREITKIKEINKNEYELSVEIIMGDGRLNRAKTTMNLGTSIFFAYQSVQQTYGGETYNSTTLRGPDTSPRSFDISDIKLCMEIPFPGNTTSETCEEDTDDYTDILR